MIVYSTCAKWINLGTRIWLKTFFHHGSMFLMSPWWSGSTGGLLDLCVSAASSIPLTMISIPVVALSTPFCGYHILWSARTGQLNSVWRNGKIWVGLLGSFYECVSQYFWLESLFFLTVDFLCQRGSQHCWSLVYTLLFLSRSANTGPRVYRGIPLTNTFLTNLLLMWICCGYRSL